MPHSSPISLGYYRTVGVLGGMGPLATVDFLRKVVLATPATRDQDHVPMLVRFCPEVPDRVDALLGGGPSPESALVAAAQSLERGGALCLAMPCNTAHAWYDAIARAVSIPVLHIADAVLAEAAEARARDAVGLLATTGTLHSGIYPSRGGPGVRWLLSGDVEQAQWVSAGIQAIKSNRLDEGERLLVKAADALVQRGAKAVVMGCTEIPIVLSSVDIGVPLLDSTLALARACVAWAGASLAASPDAAPLPGAQLASPPWQASTSR
jgi:aspartate racemase